MCWTGSQTSRSIGVQPERVTDYAHRMIISHLSMSTQAITRRFVLALAGTAPLAALAASRKQIPVGLQLYSVRDEVTRDLRGTLRAVARQGYQVVEFFAPYLNWTGYSNWTAEQAKDVRKLLDELGIACHSTHNGSHSFAPERIDHTIELNRILGSKYIVMASAGGLEGGPDGWKAVADRLNTANEKMKSAGLRAGYHNHRAEFAAVAGQRPIDIVAARTTKDILLQLDVGTCVHAGVDPVAWIEANPGRIRSIHCKEWSSDADMGYRVLFGEGVSPWKKIFAAAEKVGGVEYYLIEQEGSRLTPLESVAQSLANYTKLRG